MANEKPVDKSEMSGREVLDRLITLHDEDVRAQRSKKERLNRFREDNPEEADNADVVFHDGELAGRRESSIAVRSLIERVASEIDGETAFEGVSPDLADPSNIPSEES